MGKRNASKTRTRAYLYSPERPDKGVLFRTEDAIAEALEQGWEESPDEARAGAGEAKAKAKAKAAASKGNGGNGKNNGGAKKVTTGDDR